LVVAILVAAVVRPCTVVAHTLPISFLRLQPEAEFLHAELVLNPFELNFFSELDRNHDGRFDDDELKASESALVRRIVESLRLFVRGEAVAAEVAGVAFEGDTHHVAMRAHYHVDARRAPLRIQSALGALTSGSHVTHVVLAGEPPQQARLDMQTTSAVFGNERTERGTSTKAPLFLAVVFGNAEAAAAEDSRAPVEKAKSRRDADVASVVVGAMVALPCLMLFIVIPLLLRRQMLRARSHSTHS